MKEELLADSFPKGKAVKMLYKSTEVIIRSPDAYTDNLDILAGVFLGNTLTPFLSKICLVHKLRTLIDQTKKDSFTLKKKKQTISLGNYY